MTQEVTTYIFNPKTFRLEEDLAALLKKHNLIAYSTPYRGYVKPIETIRLLLSLEGKTREAENLRTIKSDYEQLQKEYEELKRELEKKTQEVENLKKAKPRRKKKAMVTKPKK
ncbi:MAG: hypothetical protein ACE5Z5_08390 [Candidatus Bathyarchaeia archaeon]